MYDESPPGEVLETCGRNRFTSLAGRIFTPTRLQWAITAFKPYKAAGGDGIFPALLQKCIKKILAAICKLYKASFKLGYIPKLWRTTIVVFIPEGGWRPSVQPKSYRPISLSSFIQKGMEKVLD